MIGFHRLRNSWLPVRRGLATGSMAIVLATAVLSLAVAAEPPAATPSESSDASRDRPEKLVLFDGKTLDGWKKTEFGGEAEVRVDRGMIVLPRGLSMTGITSVRKDLPTTNYELSYEAMRLDGYDFFAAATFPVGKSHATLVNGGWGGSVTGISSIDYFDASENETCTFQEYKDKTWYKFRIRVTDEKLQCWVDDEQIIDIQHQGRRVDTRFEVELNKPLGFASWETGGAVRNITLRKLTPEEIAEINKS